MPQRVRALRVAPRGIREFFNSLLGHPTADGNWADDNDVVATNRVRSPRLALGPWHDRGAQKSPFGADRKVIELQRDQADIVGEIFSAGKLLNFLDELPA